MLLSILFLIINLVLKRQTGLNGQSRVPASPNLIAIFDESNTEAGLTQFPDYHNVCIHVSVMFRVMSRCMFCKSPAVTPCGWWGCKPSINKQLSVCLSIFLFDFCFLLLLDIAMRSVGLHWFDYSGGSQKHLVGSLSLSLSLSIYIYSYLSLSHTHTQPPAHTNTHIHTHTQTHNTRRNNTALPVCRLRANLWSRDWLNLETSSPHDTTSFAKMANWREEVLLEGDFSIPLKRRTQFKVTLIPGGIFYSQISTVSTQYEEKSVQISDVIGCHCSPSASLSPTRLDNNIASFTVFTYPFRKKMFSGKKTRHRVTVTFEVNSCRTLEENKKIALQWNNVINCLARGTHVKIDGEIDLLTLSPLSPSLSVVSLPHGPHDSVSKWLILSQCTAVQFTQFCHTKSVSVTQPSTNTVDKNDIGPTYN